MGKTRFSPTGEMTISRSRSQVGLLERWEIVKMSDILQLETQYPVNHFFFVHWIWLLLLIGVIKIEKLLTSINQKKNRKQKERLSFSSRDNEKDSLRCMIGINYQCCWWTESRVKILASAFQFTSKRFLLSDLFWGHLIFFKYHCCQQ